jgi:peptidoglycan/xylan/chitin deacetylase (PgdA/CDA1 family)
MAAIKTTATGIAYALGAAAMRSPLLRPLREHFYRRRVNIVYYHGVWEVQDARRQLFGGIDTDRLHADLDVYTQYFSIVPLERLLDDHQLAAQAPRPPLAICFDDGFDLVGGGACQLLAERGVPATAFICQDAYAGDGLLWQHALQVIHQKCGDTRFVECFNAMQKELGLHDTIHTFMDYHAVAQAWPQQGENAARAARIWTLAGLEDIQSFRASQRPYMEEDELRTWLDHGHALGCHSRSHPFSSALTETDVEREYLLPAKDLEERFAVRKPALAYPFGDRLAPAIENSLLDMHADRFHALLGTHRLSHRSELASRRIDRVEVEFDLSRALFGEPPLQVLRGRAY